MGNASWIWIGLLLGDPGTPLAGAAGIDFDRDIRPILATHCFQCHGPDAATREAGLRLDQRESALAALDSGARAIVPADVDASELARRIRSEDPDEVMPPPAVHKPLSPADRDRLIAWIAAGAEWRKPWAYTKPTAPEPPSVRNPSWIRNPLDAFVLARLEAEGLSPSPEADRTTLLRRVSLDLVGLPPTAEELEAFLSDSSEDAYERAVDRLLASPHYGERQARAWLDMARYADSQGYEKDAPRTMWRYRDWVIQAFNHDLPFDQFTLQQFAGDLLPEATLDTKIATGFHRNTMTNTEGGTDNEEFRVAAVVDRVNTTMEVWMGSTFACAQCHDHKYDPFTQKEYYQLLAFLNSTADADRDDEFPTILAPTPEQEARLASLTAEKKELLAALSAETPERQAAQRAWEASLGGPSLWMPVALRTASSHEGAALAIGTDGEVRALGANPASDTYELEFDAPEGRIAAIRIETISDNVDRPAGRSANGNFVLTHLAAERTGPPSSSSIRSTWRILDPIGLSRPAKRDRSFSWAGQSMLFAIDEPIRVLRLESTAGELPTTGWTAALLDPDGMVKPVEMHAIPTEGGLILQSSEPLPPAPGRLLRLLGSEVGSELVLRMAASADADAWQRGRAGTIRFVAAAADAAQEGWPAEGILQPDGKGWAALGKDGEAPARELVALTEPADPVLGGSRWKLRLAMRSEHAQHTLAAFRVWVATGGQPLEWVNLPADIRSILALPQDQRSMEQQSKLASHYRGIAPELEPLRKRLAEIETEMPKPPIALVLQELDKPRETHIMVRGNFRETADKVEAEVPAALHPFPADVPRNRVGLARWLTSEENPLVGRVLMNRLWAQYFGRGIVETSNDFGAQGEPPSHPELLDWLAVEFVRQGWSLKAMHRQLVTSATYRQSSKASPELVERDPMNRLFGRAARFRLEAELLRDQALAASGLLTRTIGGPSVFPYQPDGIWDSPYSSAKWQTSPGPDGYRRGIYTYWRRTSPYPTFMTFDAPSRELSCERRPRSNTPLQALATLNDPAFVDCARALARRTVAAVPTEDPAERLEWAMRQVLARSPQPPEREALVQLLNEAARHYAERPDAAEQLVAGELPIPRPEVDVAELAAWTLVSNILLNLDEAVTRE